MKKQKKKIILLIVLLGIAVALLVGALMFEPDPDKKGDGKSTLQTLGKFISGVQKNNKDKETDGKANAGNQIVQKSDGSGKNAPVQINTDGTVDIKKLEGYKEDTPKEEQVSESRIEIKSIGSYSGPYVEDGSDEEVKDILAIVVTNVSKEFLQYSEITMTNGGQNATFSLSNLPAGASAVVLANDRNPAGADWKYKDDVTAFIKKSELHEDIFSWEAGDNLLVLKNNSKEKHSKVYVYYKNTEDGVYVGGITYRMAFDDLEAGESRQKLSKHFKGNSSHVMMIDFID